uniref:Uncharacterized protein n=1 Tax=Anguilla anguilla TaxID=7936 RepID=A0A0E9Q126_ANGAN
MSQEYGEVMCRMKQWTTPACYIPQCKRHILIYPGHPEQGSTHTTV